MDIPDTLGKPTTETYVTSSLIYWHAYVTLEDLSNHRVVNVWSVAVVATIYTKEVLKSTMEITAVNQLDFNVHP